MLVSPALGRSTSGPPGRPSASPAEAGPRPVDQEAADERAATGSVTSPGHPTMAPAAGNPTAPTAKAAKEPAPRTPRDLWRELVSGELFDVSLRLSPAHIKNFVDTAKDVGDSLKNAWRDLRKKIGEVLDLPQVQDKISPEARDRIEQIALTAATAVAFTAAGVQGLAGFHKLRTGIQQKSRARILEGSLDLATAAAIGTTVAGLTTTALVLGPLAAGLGVVRGSLNGVVGFRRGDSRHELQGLLDASRSASIGSRLLAHQSTLLATSGMVLGAVAGLIQVSRGYYDLSVGLKQVDRPQQVQGLTDIGSAVGLSLAALGVGTVPGIILAGLSVTARVLYQFSPRAQKRMDRALDRLQPALAGAVRMTDRVVDPLLDRVVRPLIGKVTGWKRGDQAAETSPPSPEKGSGPVEQGTL